MKTQIVILAVAWLAVASGASAQTETLARARAAYGAGELRQAITLYEQALEERTERTADLAEIYVHLGILAGIRQDAERAARNFEYALAFDPTLALPSEVGPRERELVERIRAERAGRRATVQLSTEAGSPLSLHSLRVRARVVDAPSGLAAKIQVQAVDAQGQTLWSHEGDASTELTYDVRRSVWDGTRALTVTARALNDAGSVVAEASASLAGRAADAPMPVEPDAALTTQTTPPSPEYTELPQERETTRDIWSSPWLWTGVVLVAGAATASFLLFYQSEPSYVVGAPTFALGSGSRP